MITREQMQELKELAKQVKYKAVRDGQRLRVENTCSTIYFAYDQDGYQEARSRFERLGGKLKKQSGQDATPSQDTLF